MSRLRWITPEGFAFELPLAGLGTRCLAWVVDAMVVGAALTAAEPLLRALAVALPGVATAAGIALNFALTLLYAAALEWFWQGQTVGKFLLGLRVMDAHGLPLTGAQVLTRNLLRVVDMLPLWYLVGGMACLSSRRWQRLGDQVAGTVVAQRRSEPAPDRKLGLGQKYNSFQDYPHLALRLRKLATPAEAGLALQALRRREELDPGRRQAVYRELVEYFQTRVPFPAEAMEALSPEQHLRNLVGILFPQRNE